MAKKLNDGRWACEFCDYISPKEGWTKNHESLKHGGGDVNKARQATGQAVEKDGVVRCPDCKGTNIRLLNSSNPEEKIAKQKGYKKICNDCEEVF